MNHCPATIARLAREFSRLLADELAPAEFRHMVELNRAGPPDSPVCHSHDFIDSNVIMGQAFQNVTGRELDTQSDSDMAAFNGAWRMAKAAAFYSPDMTESEFRAAAVIMTPARYDQCAGQNILSDLAEAGDMVRVYPGGFWIIQRPDESYWVSIETDEFDSRRGDTLAAMESALHNYAGEEF